MLGSGHLISGAGIAIGVLVLLFFAAWGAMSLFTVFAVRRVGKVGTKWALWGSALVLSCVMLTGIVVERVMSRDIAAERRALEARASELLVHAIAPGSALTCLDAVSAPVETACEKTLFASPETVAAAVAYIEARYSLLVASAALAARDPSYQPAVERLRRGIEEDRFGLVAQLLSTRGCNPADCPDFAVLRDSKRIAANMKEHVFANHIESHGMAWNSSHAASALASAPMPASTAALRPPLGVPPEAETNGPAANPSSTGTAKARFSYPSSETIPQINIMEPETDSGSENKGAAAKRTAPRVPVPRDRTTAAAPQPNQSPATAPPQTETSGSR